jgi:hypothetical protein
MCSRYDRLSMSHFITKGFALFWLVTNRFRLFAYRSFVPSLLGYFLCKISSSEPKACCKADKIHSSDKQARTRMLPTRCVGKRVSRESLVRPTTAFRSRTEIWSGRELDYWIPLDCFSSGWENNTLIESPHRELCSYLIRYNCFFHDDNLHGCVTRDKVSSMLLCESVLM